MPRQKVVSTAKLRTKPTLKNHFNAASSRFHFKAYDLNKKVTRSKDRLEIWNRFIPLSPKDAEKILLRGLPKGVSVKLWIDSDGDGDICFSGPDIKEADCHFSFKKAERGSGSTSIHPRAQSKGLGRKIIRNEIEFLKACGIKKFSVFAASEAGGYTWARFGYVPENDSLEFIRKKVNRSYNALKDSLNPVERRQIERFIKIKSAKDVHKLADTEIDLSSRLAEMFNAVNNDNITLTERKRYKRILETLETSLDIEGRIYIDSGAGVDKSALTDDPKTPQHPVKLGRLLLAGLTWRGTLNLNSAPQMRRVDEYVGGFKYIDFKPF